jgi:hypothetical protein
MLDWNAQSGNDFRVNLALLVNTSDSDQPTTGGLLADSAPKNARILQSVSATHYTMSASHSFVAMGWYQVPGEPKVTTTVKQKISAISNQSTLLGVHNHYGYTQVSHQRTAATDSQPGSLEVTTDSYLAKLFNLPAGWSLRDEVSRLQDLNGTPVFQSLLNDTMSSVVASGAHVSAERWRYADTQGVCGTTKLAGNNGVVVTDVKTPRCVWTPGGASDKQ